ncbi:hypothetical protein MMC25_004922 [Agyrium rufum]|nr:hypothetical protein [Agyrium rufum]
MTGVMQLTAPDCVSLYSPLEVSISQIRLLIVCPSENHDADINCRLDVVAFQDSSPPTYEALSYAWGPAYPKFKITVNDHSCEIGHNLYTALRYLRRPYKPRTLWIDAVCINQTDAAEKDHQIRQMGAIYTNASSVIVWLGESDDDIEIAMDMLCDMETRLDVSELDWYLDNSEPKLDWYITARTNKSVHPGLNKLFNKPWFNRIWVVQEVSLSQRIPIILSGKRELSYKLLWDLKFHLGLPTAYGNDVHKALGLDCETCSEMKNFPAKWNRQASHFLKSDEELFKSFLLSTSKRDCTETRDRIFALLGLLSPQFALTHFPDYNEPTAKIYQRAMMLLLASGNLYWLLYAKNQKVSHLPSWCIDFSTKWMVDDGFLKGEHSRTEQVPSEQAHFMAAGELDIFKVQGAEFGRVNLSAQRLGDLKTKDVSFILTSVEEEIKIVKDFAETIGPFFAAVYQNLRKQLGESKACDQLRSGDIWKLIGYGEDGLSFHMRDAKRWPVRLETYLWLIDSNWRVISKPWSLVPSILSKRQLTLLEQGLSFLDMLQQRYIPLDAELRECGAQLVWLILRLSKCSLFVASEASKFYYGKADGMIEEGDILCLLIGFDAPAILRPKEAMFQLVGFAYVPTLIPPQTEIMYGSGFQLTVRDFGHGKVPLEDIKHLEKREFCLI